MCQIQQVRADGASNVEPTVQQQLASLNVGIGMVLHEVATGRTRPHISINVPNGSVNDVVTNVNIITNHCAPTVSGNNSSVDDNAINI